MTSPSPAVYPITDRVREALAVTRRGCEELIPEDDWVKKLARSVSRSLCFCTVCETRMLDTAASETSSRKKRSGFFMERGRSGRGARRGCFR